MQSLSNKGIIVLFSLSAVEILITGAVIALIPGDPKNAVLWGFSIFRLVNLAGIFLLATVVLTVLFYRKVIEKIDLVIEGHLIDFQNWSKSCWLVLLFSVLFFILLQIPSYQLKDNELIWERLSPNFFLGELLALNGMLYLLWIGYRKSYFPKRDRESAWGFLKSIFPFVIVVLVLVMFVVVTRIGIAEDDWHWNTAGVPILASQVLLVLFGYLILIGLRSFGLKEPVSLNLSIMFILLWSGASLLWIAQPITRNYFVHLPKNTLTDAYYPKSDAQRFDQGAELMLLGEGIYGGITEEKPFLMATLALVKVIGGDDYQDDIKVQVVILALIIPGLFLIGKELHSHEFGLVLALMGALYEIKTVNSSGYINNVHVKLIMSEPYSLLGMVWVVYFFIRWRKNPDSLHLGMATFALVGFFSFVRANFIVVFFLIFLTSIFIPAKAWLKNLRGAITASISMVGITLPWTYYAYHQYGYITMLNKIQFILKTRYIDVITFMTFSGKIAKPAMLSGSSIPIEIQRFGEYTYAVIAYFFNNLIKSVLIFPAGLKFDKISVILDQPYWDETIIWDGKVGVAFFINLIIIIIGIAGLYKKHRGIALIPLILSIGYYISLALAKTSGGRYLGPGIWVYYLYYFSGLCSIFFYIVSQFGWETELFLKDQQKPKNVKPNMVLLVSFIIVLVGFSVPLADYLIPQKYEEKTQRELIEILQAVPEFEEIYQTNNEVAKFVDSGDGKLYYGDLHYPVPIPDPELDDVNHYEFSILGPSLSRYSHLQSSVGVGNFEDGAAVVGFGCRNGGIDQLIYLYFIEDQSFFESDTPFHEICHTE